jgi:Mg2+ and Co2+ transporter CorA
MMMKFTTGGRYGVRLHQGQYTEIERDLISQRTKEALARRFGVCRKTVISFLKSIKGCPYPARACNGG